MAEAFLNRYNEELGALRRRAARFAESFPKIAGRLRISGEVADDPHVERLIQSFAYSAARVRQKLDDEFPELTDSLLETLYPHYLAPIPSMSIVRLSPSEGLAAALTVPRHTEILGEPVGGESCRFRTTQDVIVAPIELTEASLSGQPMRAPPAPAPGAVSCLQLSLRGTSEKADFGEIGLSRLRLFLGAPWRQAIALHELLLNHTVGLALARHADDDRPIFLPKEMMRPVGFDPEQAMLPYPEPSFIGYRLITEFFALPQKFLFFEISGLDRWRGDSVRIFVYLRETDGKLERSLSAKDFVLNATPVVNLFRQRAEPIVIDGTRTEYRLVPDARRQRTREIHSVDMVTVTDRKGNESPCEPFFGSVGRARRAELFWQLRRRFDADDRTSDIDIAFVGSGGKPAHGAECVASIDTLCLNRDLPEKLPFGGGHPYLQLASNSDAVARVTALMPPTQAARLSDEDGRRWRLTSHLLLNHLSLTDGGGGALKDILSLYAFRDMPETKQMVDAIVKVEARNSTARLGHGGVVPGTDILVEFDPASIDRPGAFLFGSVLDRFFGLYTSVNSFTRLTVALKGHARPVSSWPARAAERPLL